MELTSEDRFGQDLAQLPAAPNFHTPTLGDDVGHFVEDLGQSGLGRTGATFRAAASSALQNDIVAGGISDDWMLAREYEPIVEALNKVQQRQPRGWFTDGTMIGNPYLGAARNMEHQSLDELWGEVAKERVRNPGIFGQLPKDHAEVVANARQEQRTAADYSRLVAASGGPITGTAAQFAGGAVGGMADPLNIAASVAGFPASESLLKTALIEGAGNAAITAATLPARAQHYADIGEPMSAGDMAGEVVGSAGVGAGFGVGGKLIARLLGLKGHALVDEFRAKVADPAPNLRTAAAMVEDEADRATTNPFANTAEGRDLHRQAILQTQEALDNRDPGLLPDMVDQAEASARAIAPEAFAVHESAAAEIDALRLQIQSLGEKRAALPEVAHYQARIQEILSKVNGVEDRLTVKAAERLAAVRDRLDERMSRDTPQMAFLRRKLLAADLRMRDVGPNIAAARAAAAEGGFTTAKGSTYDLHSDGTTTRNKAARFDVGHEGQQGPQPRSDKTYFVTPGHADQLGLFQTQGGPRMAIAARGGQLGVKYLSGKDAGKFEARTLAPHSSRPAAGLIPVEVWKDGTRVHFGNMITEVRAPDGHALPASIEGPADKAQHRRNVDPEALKPFTDPIKKPDAFRQQAEDLALELSPAPEKPVSDSARAADGQTEPSPYGDAAPQIEALERLDGAALFADPLTGGTTKVKDATADAKRQARAVERLRGCIEGGS